MSWLFAWLVLVFGIGSPQVANLTNEHFEIISYAYIRAVDTGINPAKFVKLIHCESRFDKNAKGDYRTEEDRYMARGILQYWPKTFSSFAKKYKLEGTYLSPYSQINLATAMIRDGGIYHWKNCGIKTGMI